MMIIWLPLLISFLTICNGEDVLKKRVCVIGAGRVGLAAVKLMADEIDYFNIVAFERNSDVGGMWIYRDDPNLDEHGLPAHSGIYKHLKTNIPKIDMSYPDYPNFEGEENSNYASHQLFLEYMRNYTRDFNLRQYIQLNTLVTKVHPINKTEDWKTTKWIIETKNLTSNETNSTSCDAVIVCNGRFSKPNIPEISGIETFPGKVLHSRAYRIPDNFTNETVIVLGAGNSGIDITLDLSNYAKTVYLSHRHLMLRYFKMLPDNVIVSQGVVSVNGSEFTLRGKSKIVADSLIYCTGYSLDFPFLDNRSDIVIDGKDIDNLYKRSINAKHPSMAFVGLTFLDSPRVYYNQIKYFKKILQGKEKLPSYEEMIQTSFTNPLTYLLNKIRKVLFH